MATRMISAGGMDAVDDAGVQPVLQADERADREKPLHARRPGNMSRRPTGPSARTGGIRCRSRRRAARTPAEPSNAGTANPPAVFQQLPYQVGTARGSPVSGAFPAGSSPSSSRLVFRLLHVPRHLADVPGGEHGVDVLPDGRPAVVDRTGMFARALRETEGAGVIRAGPSIASTIWSNVISRAGSARANPPRGPFDETSIPFRLSPWRILARK